MSDPTRCLLDKVTARRILEGLLKLAEARDPGEDELYALDLFKRPNAESLRLFIAPPTNHLLHQLNYLPRYAAVIDRFLNHVGVTQSTRYFKRWARRLQDYGFTPEDAHILALATFGSNPGGDILGMDFVATFDQPMIRQWATQFNAIQDHLMAMRNELPDPYRQAVLPQVRHPAYIKGRNT